MIFRIINIVLNIGPETEDFNYVNYLDFASIIDKIDYLYMDNNPNKYSYLLKENKLNINRIYPVNTNDYKMVAEDQGDYESH